MKKMSAGCAAVLACALTFAPLSAMSLEPAQAASSVVMPASPELLTKTVHEVWVDSGRNEDKFFDVVKQFAEMSAQKRGVALPDSAATGQKMGMLIKASARRDPDQLLYSVVDAAVRQTTKAPAAPVPTK